MREMKDSGIEWLNQVPSEWIKYRIIDLVKFLPKSNIQAGEGEKEGLYPFYTSSQELNKRVDRCLYPENSITMATGGFASVNLSKEPYSSSTDCLNFNSDIVDIRIIYYNLYYLKDGILNDLYFEGMGLKHLQKDKFSRICLFIPGEYEQKVIADFLDKKCSEIDALTKDIEKQIEVLEDYKKSIVYNSICKGIRNSKLKKVNSDVWKEIPENWDFKDIKYVFEIVKRIAGKEGYDVISVTQTGLKYKDITSGDGQLAKDYSGYQFVYPTDYVMTHMDLLTGWVDCSTLFGVTSPDYRVFRLRNKVTNNLDYFKHLMQSCYMSRIFYSLGYGVSTLGRWRLQAESFNNFMIPVPPLEEQVEIAEYLNDKINNVNELIKEKEKELEILADYKKSLIYEYVTGKKEVSL